MCFVFDISSPIINRNIFIPKMFDEQTIEHQHFVKITLSNEQQIPFHIYDQSNYNLTIFAFFKNTFRLTSSCTYWIQIVLFFFDSSIFKIFVWGQSWLQNLPTGSGHATGVNKCSFPFNGLSNQLKLYMIGSEGSIYFDLDKLIGYRNYV